MAHHEGPAVRGHAEMHSNLLVGYCGMPAPLKPLALLVAAPFRCEVTGGRVRDDHAPT